MAAEPHKFILTKDGEFDGQTLMDFERGAFQAVSTRIYSIDFTGNGGVINADFFGVFSDLTPKIVGVSGGTWNPYSTARVVTQGTPEPFRQEVQLTPEMTHVVMYPGDSLAITTHGEGRPTVQLVVNELSESEHVTQALTSHPTAIAHRYRIINTSGAGFLPDPGGVIFEPAFAWSATDNIMKVVVNGASGPIPASYLCPYPNFQGCYVSVRYAKMASDDGKVHLVEGQLRDSIVIQESLRNVEWSKVFFVSHDDHISLETPGPDGNAVIADLELVRVRPGDRLCGRYARGL
jgi:hypothetical protein